MLVGLDPALTPLIGLHCCVPCSCVPASHQPHLASPAPTTGHTPMGSLCSHISTVHINSPGCTAVCEFGSISDSCHWVEPLYVPAASPCICTTVAASLICADPYACCAQLLSRVQLFVTPWTVTHQAPLSMGFSRQEYWRGLPCPPTRDLLHTGANLCLLCLLYWKVGSVLLMQPGSTKDPK